MKVTAKATFVHGSRNMKRGETADLPAATAKELIDAGLAREAGEKEAPTPANKMAEKPANKAKADAKE